MDGHKRAYGMMVSTILNNVGAEINSKRSFHIVLAHFTSMQLQKGSIPVLEALKIEPSDGLW